MTTNDAPFRFTQEGNLSILTLLPELNNVQWGEIDAIGTQVLSSLESQAHPLLIVDLSPLSYMGSAMVALIVRAWKATQPKKGKICVVCPHASVREVLKLAALDKVWDIVDDMDEARALVGASRSAGTSGGSSSSSGAGLWIIGLILLIACGALVTFAVKPELLGMKSKKEETPASQTETEPNNTESDSKDPEEPSEPSTDKNTTDKPDASAKQPEVEKPASKETTSEKKAAKKEEKPKKEQAEKKEAEPVKKEEVKPKEEKTPTKPEVKSEPKPESKPTPETKAE